MAKAAHQDRQDETGTNGSAAPAGGETTSAYFRRIFRTNPKLLRSKSNEEILTQWLADHPDHDEVPRNVRNNLANIKSVLRKKGRNKPGRKPREALQGEGAPARAMKPAHAAPQRKLESLEEQIDDCLTAAKTLDREGLDQVIVYLRRARNEVVWKLGE